MHPAPFRAILLAAAASFCPALLPAQASTPAIPAAPQTTTSTSAATADTRRQQLITSNGPGTDPALVKQLLTMRDQDQAARGIHAAPTGQPVAMATNLAEIDATLTSQLKTIVEQHGWPTIALVGLDASNAATLLLTHTADHAWQRSLLPQLTTLADQHKIDAAPLAFVIDKELIAEGKPQRYGTQFRAVDGSIAMVQVEDPGGLDNLRARFLLPPIDVYKAQLARLYHLKPSNRILSPEPVTP